MFPDSGWRLAFETGSSRGFKDYRRGGDQKVAGGGVKTAGELSGGGFLL